MTNHLLRPAMHTINLDLPFMHHADSDFRHPQVLPPQTHNQAARLGSKRRTTLPTLALPPAQQRPVPAAQRPRTHRKARPALGRQQTARSRPQRPVDRPVPRSLPTPPEDRELVSQHHDLELPLTTTPDEHPDQPAQKPIQQRHFHDAQSCGTRQIAITNTPRPTGTEFLYPTRWT